MHKMSILKQQFVILRGAIQFGGYLFEDYYLLLTIWTTVAGVEQNRYKTNNGCIKHLPQTDNKMIKHFDEIIRHSILC